MPLVREDKKYEKVGELASGGMATVYFGRARGVGGFERRVAIKEMHAHLAKEGEFIRMFFDEARLASRIHHPNVVATLDMSERGGVFALILEYVEGPTLQQIMKYLADRGGFMPLDIALRIFLDILAGLHAAHELINDDGRPLNLVHRDVSPQNMLVGTEGITKITDFGIARAESRLSNTRTGSVKGKVPYMSPEQVKSLPIDRRTDVYAAGVILWEMLTSQRLVQGETDVAMIYQVTDREPTPPKDWNPMVPDPIAKECLRALEKRVENRFSTAAQLMEALEVAAHESQIEPATPRAVGAYVRGLGLHRPATDFEAESRRRSQLNLEPYPSPESSSSTSLLTAVVAPYRALESSKRTMLIAGASAAAVMLIGGLWISRSSIASAPSTATNPPPRTTTAAASPATNPVALPTNPTLPAAAPTASAVSATPTASAAAPTVTANAASTATPGTKKTTFRRGVYNPQGL